MYRSSGGGHYEQLETFIDQGYIEEILGLVKTGKEASVVAIRNTAEPLLKYSVLPLASISSF